MNLGSNQKSIQREHLVTAHVGRSIDRVEAHRIVLQPLQASGLHEHAGGTIGYVVDGEIAFQLEDEAAAILHDGDAFVAPAGQRVARFDNLSKTSVATFVAVLPTCGRRTADHSAPVAATKLSTPEPRVASE